MNGQILKCKAESDRSLMAGLFANYKVLLVETADEFYRAGRRRNLKVNVNTSKYLKG